MTAPKFCLLIAVHLLLGLACMARGLNASGDTWVVIISSSRYWLNYRHTSNALGIYQAVKRLGVPDSHIILMLAEQPGCSPRNVHPGRLHLAPGSGGSGAGEPGGPVNLLDVDTEIDYRGREVSVDSVLRLLTGHHLPGTPASKRLRSGPASRLLVYMTGHGGDEFLKFHDEEELLAADIASAVHQMAAAGRYRQLLLLADTCQAGTLFSSLSPALAPNVLAVASSKLGQSSYAHNLDTTVGQHLVDQASYHLHSFLWRLPLPGGGGNGGSGDGGGADGPSLQQLLDYLGSQQLSSEVQVRGDLSPRSPSQVPVTDFFAAAAGGGAGGAEQPAASPAAMALMQLARRQQAQAAGAVELQEPEQRRQATQWLQLEAASGAPLWAGTGQEAAAVVGVWAAAVLLVHLVLRPC